MVPEAARLGEAGGVVGPGAAGCGHEKPVPLIEDVADDGEDGMDGEYISVFRAGLKVCLLDTCSRGSKPSHVLRLSDFARVAASTTFGDAGIALSSGGCLPGAAPSGASGLG